MSMIERVARAIAMARGLEAGQWVHFRASAVAAVKVMRELEGAPLMAAYEAAVRVGGAIATNEIIKVWQAAIDAALTDTEKR